MLFPCVLHVFSALQPQTMEVVGYQNVERALPDGRPDPEAVDNHYYRTKTQWFLMLDTDSLQRLGKVSAISLPKMGFDLYRKVEEKGRIRGAFAQNFQQVTPAPSSQLGKVVRFGRSEAGARTLTSLPTGRTLVWVVRSVIEEVETHREGRRRATRSCFETAYGVHTVHGEPGKPFFPPLDPWMSFGGPKVQVDAPKFGYKNAGLPRESDF